MATKIGGELTRKAWKVRPSKAHLATLKAAAREEGFVNRQRGPLERESFSGFLRTGFYG